jgi:hypothetical protein
MRPASCNCTVAVIIAVIGYGGYAGYVGYGKRTMAHHVCRVTRTTPSTMKPMPSIFCAVSDSPNRYQAATAFST